MSPERPDPATREDELAAAYQRARPRLISIGYAILGSRAEAEDVVSECWFRLVGADAQEPVREVEAWATVVVGRAALDLLTSARHRRERYVGPWLPEPVVRATGAAHPADPAELVALDESIGYALLIVLESLSPAERTAWVLHDLFGMTFREVATTLGRTPAAVRQAAARARAHVDRRAARTPVDRTAHAEVVGRFLDAAVGGDLGPLLQALDPVVVAVADGGGEVSAARRPVTGSAKVGRFLRGILDRPERRLVRVEVNGEAALGVVADGAYVMIIAFTLADRTVTRLDIVRAPSKLPRQVVHGTRS